MTLQLYFVRLKEPELCGLEEHNVRREVGRGESREQAGGGRWRWLKCLGLTGERSRTLRRPPVGRRGAGEGVN